MRRKLTDMSHSELEAKLDEEVSFFVRASRARNGLVNCFTCGVWKHWKEVDCGHYIPRHRRGTRWDLRNLRPQCTACNSYREGEHWLYRQKLIEELGLVEVEALENTANLWSLNKHPRDWLIAEIERWRQDNKPLRALIKGE